MLHHDASARDGLSRRSALGRLAAIGTALGLGGGLRGAAAQDATPAAMASHPIVGVWNANSVGMQDVSLATYHPDGSVNIAIVSNYMDPDHGVVFQSQGVGPWEPTGPRSAHFTASSLLTDANGMFLGSVTVDGYPVVSDDGETLRDDNSQVVITLRDASGAVTQQFSGAGSPPVTGNRQRPGAPAFTLVPIAATPTP